MRVMALEAWYTEGRHWQFDCADDQAFMEAWSGLPDDGALAFKVFYDQCAPVRLARHISGDEWYWAQLTDAGLLLDHGSNQSKEDIETRYPGAVLKRGKATSEADMHRVNQEQSAAVYWNDDPLKDYGGCCGD